MKQHVYDLRNANAVQLLVGFFWVSGWFLAGDPIHGFINTCATPPPGFPRMGGLGPLVPLPLWEGGVVCHRSVFGLSEGWAGKCFSKGFG